MERETGFEPATNSLEGCDSTPELLPRQTLRRPRARKEWWRREDSNLRRAKPGRFTVCCHCPLGHTSKEPCQPGSGGWSRHPDLNRGPTVYKTVALPLSYAGGSCPRNRTPPGHSRFQEPGESSRSGRIWQVAAPRGIQLVILTNLNYCCRIFIDAAVLR